MPWRRQLVLALVLVAVFLLSRYLLVDRFDVMSRGTHLTIAVVGNLVLTVLYRWFGSERHREEEWSDSP